MANTKNPDGRRVFNDEYTFPQDTQDLADDIFTAYNLRKGTAADRGNLTAALMPDGLMFSETDTGRVYLRRSGAWALVIGSLSARMKRSGTATSITADSWNQNLSLTQLWDQDWRDPGITAYNNGWTIPVAGEWEIDWGLAASANLTVGFTVNKASIAGYSDFLGAESGFMNQGVAILNGSKRIRLGAGDVIRLFGAAGSLATWHLTPALSWFGVRYVGQ